MEKNKYIIIALDGAAGSGKSTTARSICEKYKYIHVDTGLHYRAVSLHLLNLNIKPENTPDYLLSTPLIFPLHWTSFPFNYFLMEPIIPNHLYGMKE